MNTSENVPLSVTVSLAGSIYIGCPLHGHKPDELRTKGMGEPVENAVLDGAQVASEVCVHHHSQLPLQMRSSPQKDPPPGIGLEVWMDSGVWLLIEVFTFPDNYGGM